MIGPDSVRSGVRFLTGSVLRPFFKINKVDLPPVSIIPDCWKITGGKRSHNARAATSYAVRCLAGGEGSSVHVRTMDRTGPYRNFYSNIVFAVQAR